MGRELCIVESAEMSPRRPPNNHLTADELELLRSVVEAFAEAAKKGKFQTGYQFIPGFLVYVSVPTQ